MKRDLDSLRHSASHVLAQAVLELFPKTKLAIGPPIENGFYYDFDRNKGFTPEDLEKIEKRALEIIKRDLPIKKSLKTKAEAKKILKGQPYKLELLEELKTKPAFYQQGDFIDLCAGPHVKSTGEIKAFKILSTAGAYWKGDSKKKMLQRIYGTAFYEKKELKKYLFMLEEAKKRDHKKLGEQLDLFSFHEEAPGFPFFHPKGQIIYDELITFWKDIHKDWKYKEIKTPIILNKALWLKSGHWDNYKENMYFTKIDKKDYAVKPMNCPGGILVYKSRLHSYKEFPLRVGELGLVHRNELSGVINGLFRVRAFTQDDAHIFCSEDQITEECLNVTNLILEIYKDLGFENVILKYSDRPDVRVGEDNVWDKSEKALLEAIKASKLEYSVNKGEGAFYGPKIEFVLRDAIGRDWQCGTLQVDLNLPGRLGASFVDKDGSKKVPVMLHRALFGSLERFIGILIENYCGKLPFWISPLQTMVIPVSEDFDNYVKEVNQKIKKAGISSEVDLKNHNLNYKIRDHSLSKIPILLICGKKEVDSNTVTIRRLDSNKQENMDLDLFIKKHSALNKVYSK